MDNVDNVLLVLSGKGGVGKSTLSVQIALGLMRAGHRVGLLDVDLCGPSIPAMLGVDDADIYQDDDGWRPVYAPLKEAGEEEETGDGRLAVMSLAFLLKTKADPVIWRGPKKTTWVKKFISEVCWGKLDYLVVDTPPGTSDEHITMIESFRNKSARAVIVTTPQMVAIGDVRRELNFCRKASLPIAGIVENMSGYVCPHCSECTNVFSSGGGEQLALEEKLTFLGRVPIDPRIAEMLDSGKSFDVHPMGAEEGEAVSPSGEAISGIVKRLLGEL